MVRLQTFVDSFSEVDMCCEGVSWPINCPLEKIVQHIIEFFVVNILTSRHRPTLMGHYVLVVVGKYCIAYFDPTESSLIFILLGCKDLSTSIMIRASLTLVDICKALIV